MEKLLQLMQENGVTAKELTKILGLHGSAITEWKNGKTKPSIETVVKIADYFGVTTDYLLKGDVSPPRPTNKKEEMSLNTNKSFFANQPSLIIKALRLEDGLSVDAFVSNLNNFRRSILEELGNPRATSGTTNDGTTFYGTPHLYKCTMSDGVTFLDAEIGISDLPITVKSYMRLEDERLIVEYEASDDKMVGRVSVDVRLDKERSEVNEDGVDVYHGEIDWDGEGSRLFFLINLYYQRKIGRIIYPQYFPESKVSDKKNQELSQIMFDLSGLVARDRTDIATLAQTSGFEEISVISWLCGERDPSLYALERFAGYMGADVYKSKKDKLA
ncbi:MAG: helix-turn-helix domain-containing protein [Defluviitaleaceae bacterium]|nr:helix-turn-helix domain-containing protein [Defluviitaleaceae bacterium]